MDYEKVRKGLELHSKCEFECPKECPYFGAFGCYHALSRDALGLIEEQHAEIERLKKGE